MQSKLVTFQTTCPVMEAIHILDLELRKPDGRCNEGMCLSILGEISPSEMPNPALFVSSVLRQGCLKQHEGIIKWALANNANLNPKVGSSPLNIVARYAAWDSPEARTKKLNICRLLLDAGADVDFKDPEFSGKTPLNACAGTGEEEIECIRLFLERGANPLLADSNGRNALDVAFGEETRTAILGALERANLSQMAC